MKSLFQDWMARDHGEPSWRKRRYLFSIGLAVALLLAGVAVYGRAQWECRRGLAMGWSEGLPMLAMAYGSLLLLAIAVLESRVRHARQDDLILRGRTLSNIVDYITQIQEQERHEISSLLHDKMGAMLTAVKLEVELLAQRHHVPAAEIKHVEALLQESLMKSGGLPRACIRGQFLTSGCGLRLRM
jgi:signal transduction histidine kinase